MFVKVVRGKRNESVYECRSYHVHTNGGKAPSMILEFFDKPEINLQDLTGIDVYVMNNNGVTVDTYRFRG